MSESELAEHLRKAISSYMNDASNGCSEKDLEVLCRITPKLSDHDLVTFCSIIARRAFDPTAWQELMNALNKIKGNTVE